MRETTITTILSKDGERRMLIVRRDDGFFRYIEEILHRDDPLGREPVWGPRRGQSGIYQTAEEAECAAKKTCDWLANETGTGSN